MANAGHDIGIVAYYGLEGGILNLGEHIRVYPKRFDPYGLDVMVAHAQHFGAQVIMSLMDVWVMKPEEFPPNLPWIPWYPVDHEPMPAIIRAKLQLAAGRIAYSKSGVRETNNAGLDCWYVPHGVETAIFKPGDKGEARDRLHFPKDKWIVSTVAMNKGNPSRKNFCEMMHAFANFHKRHTDTFYWIQTDRGEGMADVVNIPELARNLGLIEGQDYGLPNPYQNYIGFPPDYLADVYRSSDVHMLASAGEGFGIPTLEAQACGCPVIVGGWTASEELCLAGRAIAREDAQAVYTPLAAYQFRPNVRAIELALEGEYKKATPTAKAVEQIQREYDADAVYENNWKPVLEAIEKGLQVAK